MRNKSAAFVMCAVVIGLTLAACGSDPAPRETRDRSERVERDPSASPADQDSAARADVSTLGKEIATWYVDNAGPPPAILVADEKYYLGVVSDATLLGNKSQNVVPGTPTGTMSTNWCIFVTNPEGDVSRTGVQYSAQGGLEDGDCT